MKFRAALANNDWIVDYGDVVIMSDEKGGQSMAFRSMVSMAGDKQKQKSVVTFTCTLYMYNIYMYTVHVLHVVCMCVCLCVKPVHVYVYIFIFMYLLYVGMWFETRASGVVMRWPSSYWTGTRCRSTCR